MVHLNIRSIINEVNDLDRLLNILDFPKIVMISETWINDNSLRTNVNNYTFVSSPRSTGIGGDVDFYVHNSIEFSIKNRSSDQPNSSNIDLSKIHLIKNNLLLCCHYCRLHDVILLIESVRSTSNHLRLIFGGDFNINLLDDNKISTSFLNGIHTIG